MDSPKLITPKAHAGRLTGWPIVARSQKGSRYLSRPRHLGSRETIAKPKPLRSAGRIPQTTTTLLVLAPTTAQLTNDVQQHRHCFATIASAMGALLSLPLLAIPSVGSVRLLSLCLPLRHTQV